MVNDTCNVDIVRELHFHIIVEISWQTIVTALSPAHLTSFPLLKSDVFVSVMIWTFEYKLYLEVTQITFCIWLSFNVVNNFFLNFELFSENHKPICYNIRMRNRNCNIHSWCPMGWSKKAVFLKPSSIPHMLEKN